jgi:hypothetical protein
MSREFEGIPAIKTWELERALLEAQTANPEADLTEHPIMHELARREALRLSQIVDTTGFVDATEDIEGMVNPDHLDIQWQTDYRRSEI